MDIRSLLQLWSGAPIDPCDIERDSAAVASNLYKTLSSWFKSGSVTRVQIEFFFQQVLTRAVQQQIHKTEQKASEYFFLSTFFPLPGPFFLFFLFTFVQGILQRQASFLACMSSLTDVLESDAEQKAAAESMHTTIGHLNSHFAKFHAVPESTGLAQGLVDALGRAVSTSQDRRNWQWALSNCHRFEGGGASPLPSTHARQSSAVVQVQVVNRAALDSLLTTPNQPTLPLLVNVQRQALLDYPAKTDVASCPDHFGLRDLGKYVSFGTVDDCSPLNRKRTRSSCHVDVILDSYDRSSFHHEFETSLLEGDDEASSAAVPPGKSFLFTF